MTWPGKYYKKGLLLLAAAAHNTLFHGLLHSQVDWMDGGGTAGHPFPLVRAANKGKVPTHASSPDEDDAAAGKWRRVSVRKRGSLAGKI